jgi:hypothetical protein
MSEQRPWFLVKTPADANRPGSGWVRIGAASRGKVVAQPVTWEGWLVVIGFIALLVAVPLLIWLGGLAGGHFSLAEAVVVTMLAVAILVAGFVWIIRSRSTRLPYPPT